MSRGRRLAFEQLLGENDDLDGLFAAWDVPALGALAALRAASRPMAVTTFDLGNAIAEELLQGDYVKGVVAQLPYDQGKAAAVVSLLALVGRAHPLMDCDAGPRRDERQRRRSLSVCLAHAGARRAAEVACLNRSFHFSIA